MNIIEPINQQQQQQQQVIEETERFIVLASELFEKRFAMIDVNFDLYGRAAGMYKVRGKHRQIRYNPYIFAKYFDDNLQNTVPHEVGHYVIDGLYGLRKVRPHGHEWQTVMQAFNADPSRTCNYCLSGIPQRRQQRIAYQCSCTTHHITVRRHNKVQRGEARYLCRSCRQELRPAC